MNTLPPKMNRLLECQLLLIWLLQEWHLGTHDNISTKDWVLCKDDVQLESTGTPSVPLSQLTFQLTGGAIEKDWQHHKMFKNGSRPWLKGVIKLDVQVAADSLVGTVKFKPVNFNLHLTVSALSHTEHVLDSSPHQQ